LVVYGAAGTLDRLGYFPTAWFSNPISRVVDFFSANPVLRFLYSVFPLIMSVLDSIISVYERMHSERSGGEENRTTKIEDTENRRYFYCPFGLVCGFAGKLYLLFPDDD
jgi:hypothetical protein